MAYEDELLVIRGQVLDRLTDLTANPKPTYTIDGRTFQWTEYQTMLFSQLRETNAALGGVPGVEVTEYDDPNS